MYIAEIVYVYSGDCVCIYRRLCEYIAEIVCVYSGDCVSI